LPEKEHDDDGDDENDDEIDCSVSKEKKLRLRWRHCQITSSPWRAGEHSFIFPFARWRV